MCVYTHTHDNIYIKYNKCQLKIDAMKKIDNEIEFEA